MLLQKAATLAIVLIVVLQIEDYLIDENHPSFP